MVGPAAGADAEDFGRVDGRHDRPRESLGHRLLR
jgi:hypothetical protein